MACQESYGKCSTDRGAWNTIRKLVWVDYSRFNVLLYISSGKIQNSIKQTKNFKLKYHTRPLLTSMSSWKNDMWCQSRVKDYDFRLHVRNFLRCGHLLTSSVFYLLGACPSGYGTFLQDTSYNCVCWVGKVVLLSFKDHTKLDSSVWLLFLLCLSEDLCCV